MDKDRLRLFAEEIFKQQGIQNTELFKKDLAQLIEELNIYQIELEHQNQELRFSQQELLNLSRKYQDIFNFAPVAYFIIDSNYKIVNANNTAALMLDMPLSNVKGNNFTRLIHPAFQDTFYFHFNKTFEKTFDSCFIKLKKNDNSYFFVKLVSQLDKLENKELLRIAVINNQREKDLEIALIEEKNKVLEKHNIFFNFMKNVLNELKTMIVEKNNLNLQQVENIKEAEMLLFDKGNNNFILEIISNVNEIILLHEKQYQIQKKQINLNNVFNGLFITYEKYAKQNNIPFFLNKKNHRNDYLVFIDEKILMSMLNKLMILILQRVKNGVIEFGFEINIKTTEIFISTSENIYTDDEIEVINEIFKEHECNCFKHYEALGHQLTTILGYIKILNGQMQLLSMDKGIIIKLDLPI